MDRVKKFLMGKPVVFYGANLVLLGLVLRAALLPLLATWHPKAHWHLPAMLQFSYTATQSKPVKMKPSNTKAVVAPMPPVQAASSQRPTVDLAAIYPDIVARPLFHKSRRPIAKPPVAEVVVEPPFDAHLMGIIKPSKGKGKAYFRTSPGSDEVLRVAVGEEVQGWKVKTIEVRKVTLAWQQSLKTLELDMAVPGDAMTVERGLPVVNVGGTSQGGNGLGLGKVGTMTAGRLLRPRK
jgi:hypothetical protein